MLKVRIAMGEDFDEKNNMFVEALFVEIELEHSLASLAKWESKWEKPFLGKDEKSTEETFDYIKMMTLTPNVPEEVYYKLSNENIETINTYLNSKQTATWFSDKTNQRAGQEIITAEIIYYWMVSLKIPQEYQYWHLNRLLTLVQVCNQKNAPQKKMSRRDLAARNREINAQRRASLNTRG